MRKFQNGFSAFEFLVVILVLGLIGFAGYTVYNRSQDDKTSDSAQSTEESATASDVPSAPEVNSTDDLTAAEAALDQTNLDDSSDTGLLDSSASAF